MMQPANAKCFVIDLDGVVYAGEKLIPNTPEKIAKMREKGRVFFLTNNSTLSRASYVEKLKKFGIFTDEESVVTSGYVAASYIKKRYRKPRVFVIGEEGLKDELAHHSIEICSNKCNVVLVGLDRWLTYEKLSTALKLIQNGADFIATNTDNTLITENGLLPGAGAVVAAVATASGKEPLVIGKPSRIMAEVIINKAGVNPGEILMIGDRLETDILMGKNAGMKTALVLTGYAKEEDLNASEIKPDYVLESL